MHTFSMATHPRVGRLSAVYRVLCSSPLYDPYLLLVIWQFARSTFIPEHVSILAGTRTVCVFNCKEAQLENYPEWLFKE